MVVVQRSQRGVMAVGGFGVESGHLDSDIGVVSQQSPGGVVEASAGASGQHQVIKVCFDAPLDERAGDLASAAEDQQPTDPLAHCSASVPGRRLPRLTSVSTRMLIFLSLLCGLAILLAFTLQVLLS